MLSITILQADYCTFDTRISYPDTNPSYQFISGIRNSYIILKSLFELILLNSSMYPS